MYHNSLQDIFLEAVKSLGLRFPVAEIAEKTGVGQPTVSTYLSGKRPVAQKFFKSFCEAFDLNYESLKAGKAEKDNAVRNELPTPMQILDRLSQAFVDQAAAFRAQAEIMKSIEANMARESTQATIAEKVKASEANLLDIRKDVTKLVQRQELAIEEIREQFLKLQVRRTDPSPDVRKKRGQTDGNE